MSKYHIVGNLMSQLICPYLHVDGLNPIDSRVGHFQDEHKFSC